MKLFLGLMIVVVAAVDLPAVPVRVTLTDGRAVEGEVDDATDQRQLWLRRTEGNVVLAVPYAWDSLATVEVEGDAVDVAEFRRDLAEYVTPWPRGVELVADIRSSAAAAPPLKRVAPRAVAVQFETTLANWDGDVEADGYEILLTVRDVHGAPVAVNGTLSARLVGEREIQRGRFQTNVVLERWSQAISAGDFAHGPAVYRLPFRTIRPEREVDILPGALLQVEVGAFGHGRFASSAAVPVRELNPVRDRLQHQTGSRFFRGERSERPSR